MENKTTLKEIRWNSLLELEKELEGWALFDDKEAKRMKSLKTAINKYLAYLEQ